MSAMPCCATCVQSQFSQSKRDPPNTVRTLTKNGLTLNPKFYFTPPFLAGDTSRKANDVDV